MSLKVYYVDQSAFRVGAQVEVGNADPQSATRIRRIRELQSMVPEFVAGTGGSKWLSALPTGSRWSRALPGQKGGLPNVSLPGQPAPAEPESSRVIMFRREESFWRNRSRGIPPCAYCPQRVLTKLLSPMVMA